MRWKASKAYGYVDVKLLSLSLKKQEKMQPNQPSTLFSL